MKRYISAALAVLAMAACTKNTPDNNFSIAPAFKGEKVELDVESTKVTLNGTSYEFEAGDEIIAQSSKGAVAVLTNTAENPDHFTGTFSDSLLEDGEEFSFYFNCGQPDGSVFSPVYRQEGKPWLRASQKDAHRNEDGNYGLSASFSSPDGMICLALNSGYDCTVDFTMHKAYLPIVGGNSIQGLELKAGRPAFINVSRHLGGGFYLTVHKGDDVMYCNYASESTISENSIFTVPAFTTFGISGSISGFGTNYDIYVTQGADAANAKAGDWMDKGTVSVNIEGISSKLFTFKSLTVTVDETETVITDAAALTWNGSKSFSVSLPESTGHSIGEKPVKAVLTMAIPGGEVSRELTASRHITGLPYSATPPTNTGINPWSGEANSWGGSYVTLYRQEISQTFHTPTDLQTTIYVSVGLKAVASATTTFTLYCSGNEIYTESYKKAGFVANINQYEKTIDNCTLTSQNPTLTCKSHTSAIGSGSLHTELNSVSVKYR